MILLSHPTGNENVRQAALAFREAELLKEFWTCLSWNSDAKPNEWLPTSIRRQLARRSLPLSLRDLTHTSPVREALRLFAGAVGFRGLSTHEHGPLSIDAVFRSLDRKVASHLKNAAEIDLVYAYEDGALETFRAAKTLGKARVYDLPIGYWRVAQDYYAEEREREPEWATTLSGTNDSSAKLARKDEELSLASRVVVASSFTKQTLHAAKFTAKVAVIPYGAPETSPTADLIKVRKGPLRVLYAGSLGQRKGISYLLDAIGSLRSRVELTLIGRKVTDNCRPLEEAVRRYRWIPSLPHDQVLLEMQKHDVLVLPSLFEGFGLVILEAMSQGLSVVTTPHTAGPDVIAEGVDGFVVPIRSSEAIAEKLDLLSTNPELLCEMKLAALEKAKSFRWQNYRDSLVRMAREVMKN